MQCTAKAKQTQQQCKRHAVPGARVCRLHGGAAPQVRAAAQVRLAMAVDTLIAELLRIASSSADERVRLAAVNSALDRAGISAKQQIEVAQEPTQFDHLISTIVRKAEAQSNDRELPPSPSEPAAVVLQKPELDAEADADDYREPPLPDKRPASVRPATSDEDRVQQYGTDAASRRRAKAVRRQYIDAGEPVPGGTPTRWG